MTILLITRFLILRRDCDCDSSAHAKILYHTLFWYRDIVKYALKYLERRYVTGFGIHGDYMEERDFASGSNVLELDG